MIKTKSVVDRDPKKDYREVLKEYQTTGSSFNNAKYQMIENTHLNNQQYLLYQRVLYGLTVYSQDEIKQLNPLKRKRIIKVQKKARRILNIWKQQIVIAQTNKFLIDIFPKSPLINELVNQSDKDIFPNVRCNLSFKSLNVPRNKIIEKLLQEGLLPQNFYKLKPLEPCK